jgi:hypothetical protein
MWRGPTCSGVGVGAGGGHLHELLNARSGTWTSVRLIFLTCQLGPSSSSQVMQGEGGLRSRLTITDLHRASIVISTHPLIPRGS